MNAYVFQAALLCERCGERKRRYLIDDGACARHGAKPCDDSDCLPQGPYADGGGEADSPQTCDQCGLELDNPLTEDGQLALAAESPAYFDRFDICEAHYVYAHDAGDYERRSKLDRMRFRARPSLGNWQQLNDNAQAIYARLMARTA